MIEDEILEERKEKLQGQPKGKAAATPGYMKHTKNSTHAQQRRDQGNEVRARYNQLWNSSINQSIERLCHLFLSLDHLHDLNLSSCKLGNFGLKTIL